MNYFQTSAGERRGGHYHKETRELFFIISGEIRVTVRALGSSDETEFTARAGDVFLIEPYDLHTFQMETDASWINMLSQPFDDENPDLFTVEREA